MTALVLVALLTWTCAGCGDGGTKVDKALQSSATAKFRIIEHGGKRYVVGHAIAMQIPATWVTYADEQPGTDGTTYEWAVGLPEDTRPVPAGVQFSMGKPDQGVQFDTGLPQGARELAKTAPGYKLLDEGKVDVPGAQKASMLRFERDIEMTSGTHHVEQLMLFLKISPTVSSTIRFIAGAGDWDDQLKKVYESVVVARSGS